MKTRIYYYTGTGNSLWTARCIAAELGDTILHPMSTRNEMPVCDADAIGFVFPVHMWGVPHHVLNFLKRAQLYPDKYYFAFAVNGGQVSRTLIQLQKYLAKAGISLSLGFDIVMPSNYIPWGGPGPAEELALLYSAAKEKIRRVIPHISAQQSGLIEKGPLWQRIVFTACYKMTYNMIPKMDKDFWVDEKCNGCSICEKTCPVDNIVMKSETPEWLHNCEQCLACLQWCPKEAIQYGKKTPEYNRYHHPEVTLKDIIYDPGPGNVPESN